MLPVNGIIGWILFALQLAALGAGVYALVHAARQRKDAFTAAEKMTKPIWLIILSVAVLCVFVAGAVELLGVVAVIAICVYLADVRPRVEEIQRPRY